jgi:predicted nucleotidyltransferase
MRKPVMKKEEILNILQSHMKEFQRFGVTRIGLFGSFVRDQQEEDSDVDILVEFLPAEKTFRNYVALIYLLEDLLRREVELVTPESISPYLKPYVSSEVKYVEATS